MEDHEDSHTRLGLGLSIGSHYVPKQKLKPNKSLDLSFTLCPKQEEEEEEEDEYEDISCNDYRIEPRPQRFEKRPIGMEMSSREEEEEEDANNKDKEKMNGIISRKKLRLTKDQSSLLEDSFKLHTTLNPVQKHALAEQLNLTPRQVEVWFQNRRARTKLKQTEVECEVLKKWCERLSNENKKLKKELQQLRTLQVGTNSPLSLHLSISDNTSS